MEIQETQKSQNNLESKEQVEGSFPNVRTYYKASNQGNALKA